MMTILLCSIPSRYFTLLPPPAVLSDSQRANWNENRVLVDSWKTMAFPIRVGFGNCSVVRLTCVVLVCLQHHTGSACVPRSTSTRIQTYSWRYTHPCAPTRVHKPLLFFTQFPNYPEKSWHRGRRRESSPLPSSHHVCFFLF